MFKDGFVSTVNCSSRSYHYILSLKHVSAVIANSNPQVLAHTATMNTTGVRKHLRFIRKYFPKTTLASERESDTEPISPVAELSGCLDACELRSKSSCPRLSVAVHKAANSYSSISSASGPRLKFYNPYQSTSSDIPYDAETATSPAHISWEENSTTNSCDIDSEFTPMNSWSEDDVEHSQVISLEQINSGSMVTVVTVIGSTLVLAMILFPAHVCCLALTLVVLVACVQGATP